MKKERDGLNKRKRRKQCGEAKRKVPTNEEAALERLIEALHKLFFSFGTIWAVGEELWQQALPLGYGESGREMHPGLCIELPNKVMIPDKVMMLYGSHSSDSKRREFIVYDLFDDGDVRPCNFGAFPPVGLDPKTYASASFEIRTHILPYRGRMRKLSLAQQHELRQFLHDVYAWEERT